MLSFMRSLLETHRQFRKEADMARQQGLYSPPGLLNTEQFRHAFKKLSIRWEEMSVQSLIPTVPYSNDISIHMWLEGRPRQRIYPQLLAL